MGMRRWKNVGRVILLFIHFTAWLDVSVFSCCSWEKAILRMQIFCQAALSAVCCVFRSSGLQVESISLNLSALGNFSTYRKDLTSLSLMLHVVFDSNVLSVEVVSISSIDREHFSSVSLVVVQSIAGGTRCSQIYHEVQQPLSFLFWLLTWISLEAARV